MIHQPLVLPPVKTMDGPTFRTEQFHFHFSCIGEGNGNPLPCSCLENARDGDAWWAAVSGVTQSRTRLKQLSISSSIYVYNKLCFMYKVIGLGCSFELNSFPL
uniref:Uncharacterized protein n=1 Tax=Bos indicus x Bos taurus TaxID=30522 RepID=A0A4W2F5J8_BOBOX